MFNFKKIKSTFHSEYRIEQDGAYVGYAYRCFPTSNYRVVIWTGSHQTEFKNIQRVKRLLQAMEG